MSGSPGRNPMAGLPDFSGSLISSGHQRDFSGQISLIQMSSAPNPASFLVSLTTIRHQGATQRSKSLPHDSL
jgi:hypothetical protein